MRVPISVPGGGVWGGGGGVVFLWKMKGVGGVWVGTGKGTGKYNAQALSKLPFSKLPFSFSPREMTGRPGDQKRWE